jgi:hypothetical protein
MNCKISVLVTNHLFLELYNTNAIIVATSVGVEQSEDK